MSTLTQRRATRAYSANAKPIDGADECLANIVRRFFPACVIARPLDTREGIGSTVAFAIVVLDRPSAQMRWKMRGYAVTLHVIRESCLRKSGSPGVSRRALQALCTGKIVYGDKALGEELQRIGREGRSRLPQPSDRAVGRKHVPTVSSV